MDTEATRTVVVRNHGKPMASFKIRYSDYSEDDMCIFLNDFYQTWQFWPAARTRACKCDRVGTAAGEPTRDVR